MMKYGIVAALALSDPDALSSRSLAPDRFCCLSPSSLACLLRRAISLSLDWCTVLSNERTLDDALLLPSLLLSLFFLLSLCRITWGEVRGWSVYSLLVNCCWLSCCCRCLWVSISRLVMCFYVVAMVVVMFSIEAIKEKSSSEDASRERGRQNRVKHD